MTDLANSLIEKVRKFLEEKGFNLTIEWFNYLPNHEIHKWLGVYLKIFCANSPPAIKHLKIIKKFFNEDDISRLAMRMDEGEASKLNKALSGLGSFFPTIQQWGIYESSRPENGNWYEDNFYQSEEQFYKESIPPAVRQWGSPNNKLTKDFIILSPPQAREDAINAMPFINAYDDRISIEQHYLLQAKALIELYGFKDDICQIVTRLRAGENIEEESTDQGNTDKRRKYTDEMKREAKKFYQNHKAQADNMPAKTWVDKHCIPHLAKIFKKEESFFKESTIRRNWLKLTS